MERRSTKSKSEGESKGISTLELGVFQHHHPNKGFLDPRLYSVRFHG